MLHPVFFAIKTTKTTPGHGVVLLTEEWKLKYGMIGRAMYSQIP